MKMSVVGCEASGKTVFLSALADYYNGDGRPCLVPENEAANGFQRFQLRQMRSLHQWPAATDPGRIIELKWTLRKDGDILSEIDLLEFGGETYREAFRGEKASESHQEAVDTLKQHLSASEFVVVLVSLKDLLRDQGELTPEEFERDTEALWVTRGLLAFLREHAPSAKVVIGLTQADLHRGEIAAAGDAEKLFCHRWPTIAALAHDCPVIPVASVSATDENGNPAPNYTTDGILPVMEEMKKAKTKKTKASGSRRTLLLLLLLLACFALWTERWYGPFTTWFSTPRPQPVVERIVETNVVEKTITTTNVVEATHVTEQIITLTNIVENTITKTNFVEQLPSTPTPTPTPTPSFRLWHDHRGTPIEARWISTTNEGTRIIIETTDGRQIRALVKKFSEADQLFIREQLNAATNGVGQSAQPAL